MYAQLGNIQFELLQVTDLDQDVSYEYAEHRVIEGKPLLQFTGDNLDECNVGIRFHFSFCDPETQMAALKAEAGLHQALPFQYTNGKFLGRYVITKMTQTVMSTADSGRILDLQLRVTLREWYDSNPLGSKQAAQQKAAPGLAGKGPVTNPAPAPGNRAALIGGQITNSAAQIKGATSQTATLTGSIQALAADAAAQLKAATSGISATLGPIMAQAQAIAKDGAGAAALLQGYAGQLSSYSSAIARITSGLPGPLGKIGNKIGALNRQISGQTTQIITLSQLAGGGAVETGTRAQMITRMLP